MLTASMLALESMQGSCMSHLCYVIMKAQQVRTLFDPFERTLDLIHVPIYLDRLCIQKTSLKAMHWFESWIQRSQQLMCCWPMDVWCPKSACPPCVTLGRLKQERHKCRVLKSEFPQIFDCFWSLFCVLQIYRYCMILLIYALLFPLIYMRNNQALTTTLANSPPGFLRWRHICTTSLHDFNAWTLWDRDVSLEMWRFGAL